VKKSASDSPRNERTNPSGDSGRERASERDHRTNQHDPGTPSHPLLEYPHIQTRFKLGAADGFSVARDLLLLGEYVSPVPRFDWPTLTDPKDWYLFDLLFEARTDALVTQDRAVLKAGKALDLPVLHPRDLRAAGLI
jgi:hypothetical protein